MEKKKLRIVSTNTLKDYLKKLEEEERLKEHDEVLHHLESIIKEIKKIPPVAERALAVIHAYETEFERSFKKMTEDESLCKKGCSHCCHINVEITSDEAKLLYKASVDGGLLDHVNHLEKQASFTTEDYQKPENKEYSKCVFLDKNGECEVYMYRPLSCRSYYVHKSGNSEDCNPTIPKNVPAIQNLIASIYISAVMTVEGTPCMDSMAKGLLKLIKKGKQDG